MWLNTFVELFNIIICVKPPNLKVEMVAWTPHWKKKRSPKSFLCRYSCSQKFFFFFFNLQAKARVVNESDRLIPSDSQDSDVPAARCKQKNYRTVADREGRSNPPEKPNFSPKEVLKSRVFWTLWLMMIFSQLCTSFFTTLYKVSSVGDGSGSL